MSIHRLLFLMLAIVSVVTFISATQLAIASVSAPVGIGQRCEILFIDEVSRAELQAVVTDLAKLKFRVASTDQNQPTFSLLNDNLVSRRHQLFLSAKEVGLSRKLIHNLLVDAIAKEAKKSPRDQENDAAEEGRRKKIREETDRRIKESVTDGTRAILHRIEPGTFKMGKVGEQVDVTLTKPFDMMATPTTQIIWKTVAKLANTQFGDKYRINANPSKFNGETRPVERVSYEDIQEWMNALNELSQAGEPALAQLISNHKQGDVYRLPTEAEWEFVVRGRGQNNDTYHFGSDESKLDEYAWYARNSNNKTQPVATKLPLEFNGHGFYDLHGNVFELVRDWFQDDLPGGIDPWIDKADMHIVARGGSGGSEDPTFLRSSFRNGWQPHERHEFLGFRFVRNSR